MKALRIAQPVAGAAMNDHIATQTILARRKALGMKVEEVAEATGIRAQTIRDLEQGRSVPKLDTFLLLCSALDIEVQLVPRARQEAAE